MADLSRSRFYAWRVVLRSRVRTVLALDLKIWNNCRIWDLSSLVRIWPNPPSSLLRSALEDDWLQDSHQPTLPFSWFCMPNSNPLFKMLSSFFLILFHYSPCVGWWNGHWDVCNWKLLMRNQFNTDCLPSDCKLVLWHRKYRLLKHYL